MPAHRIFDEAWYLAHNPDLAEALQRGEIDSPTAHFHDFGAAEGRPARWIEADRILAFGAFGTNNVGDEAIFRGMLKEYPDLTQIFINKPSHPKALPYPDMLEKPGMFRERDHLILGGGGLLYDAGIMDTMLRLARNVIGAGGTVSIQGIGCEAVQESYRDKVVELFGLAGNITVRTRASQRIAEELTGRRLPFRSDFAYNLAGDVGPWRGSPGSQITIGVVTNGDLRAGYDDLVKVINDYTLYAKPNERIKFVHIPHSRAFVDMHNNDIVVGQAVWSSVYSYYDDVLENFLLEDYNNDPVAMLERYRTLDGVISARFHGLVFADIVGVPALSMRGDTRKNASFAESYGSEKLFVAGEGLDLSQAFERFITDVKARKAAR